jgi:hypothetical protein
MLRKLKHYLIPSAGNRYEPGLLKTEALSLVLALVVIVELAYLVPTFLIIPSQRFGAAVLPAVLVDLANADRRAEKLSALEPDPLLARAAQLKAEDMARRGYFAHTDPDGRTPWFWLEKVGYKYAYAGENLAVNFFDSADVEQAWMNSPLHRDNILKKQFSKIGIGAARGRLDGYDTVFVVQFFARPSGGVAMVLTPDLSLDQSFQSANQAAAAGLLNLPSSVREAGLVLHLIGSPRALTNIVFAILILLILLVAILILLHRGSRGARKHLLTNALLIMLIIMSVILLNYKIGTSRAEIAVQVEATPRLN